MKMNLKKLIEKEIGVEEEDDFVVYIVDYWKLRYYFFKNN